MSETTAWAAAELEDIGVPVSQIKADFAASLAASQADHARAASGKLTVVDSYGNSSEIDSPAKDAAFVFPAERLRAHIAAHFTQPVIDALVEDAKRDLEASIVAEFK